MSALAVIPVHAEVINPVAIPYVLKALLAIAGACGVQATIDISNYGERDQYGNFVITNPADAIEDLTANMMALGSYYGEQVGNSMNSGSETVKKLYEEFGVDSLTELMEALRAKEASDTAEQFLELTAGQIKAFSDFFQSISGAIQNGNISVSRGIQGTFEELSQIQIPVETTMYFTPVVTNPYRLTFLPSANNGVPSYYYSSLKFISGFDGIHSGDGSVYYETYNGLTGALVNSSYYNYIVSQNTLKRLVSYSLGVKVGYEGYQGFKLHYNEYDKSGNYIGEFDMEVRNSVLPIADTNILSPSIPIFGDGIVALPEADTIPVTTTKDITTTFPIDIPMDTPVSIPMPDVDTMIRDLTTTGDISIPIDSDIPITIPKIGDIDTSLPDLSIPVSITNKFPFCLPFDLYRAVKVLVAPPITPEWDIKIDIPISKAVGGGNINWDFSIDFEDFKLIGTLCRWFFVLLFTFSLVKITPKIVKGAGN